MKASCHVPSHSRVSECTHLAGSLIARENSHHHTGLATFGATPGLDVWSLGKAYPLLNTVRAAQLEQVSRKGIMGVGYTEIPKERTVCHHPLPALIMV